MLTLFIAVADLQYFETLNAAIDMLNEYSEF
jgi:hypothetical protein